MKKSLSYFILLLSFISANSYAQYIPNLTLKEQRKAKNWVNKTYQNLSQEERIGQLFIVALYTNKGEDFINNVRNIVLNDKIGGIILMQDDAEKEIDLVNEFQAKSKIPMLIGMDAEWGVYQRIAKAYKLPWAITLGAVQDKKIIYEMASLIAQDCKKMGINWDFAPVIDVNTNPNNPIIGNRSFGSDVDNVIRSALAYSKALQDNNILAAIKHFPGHGDTDIDSHLDLPKISHSIERLNKIELAPFKALMNKGIGGVMVAHLYVPALEQKEGIPASVSKSIVTDLLKEKLGYKGLIITDALNMNAVANRFKAGELDKMAFVAGNDLMLFSQDVATGKKLIKEAIERGEIPQKRLEESVKKILLTKYYLGLKHYSAIQTKNINDELNSEEHKIMAQKVYSKAITVLKNQDNILPLNHKETYYYLPLEEAPFETFEGMLKSQAKIIKIDKSEIEKMPTASKIIVGIHKDNSTAYKAYKISEESKKIISELSKNHKLILNIFGSPYALKDINDTQTLSSIIVSYENNDDAMTATAKALFGKNPITGKLPVVINENFKYGDGITIPALKSIKK